MYESSLILDIECAVSDGKVNIENDKFRYFGAYSYLFDKYFFSNNLNDLQKLVNRHEFIVGFNTKAYDVPILERNGISFFKKRHIDLYEIIEKRKVAMQVGGNFLHLILERSTLDEISRKIGVVTEEDGKITDFDYDILQKEIVTPEERNYIKIYTLRDIEVEKKLYEWIEDYFKPFKFYLTTRDINNKSYLTSSIASFAYKALCKSTGIPEEYGEGAVNDDVLFSGGYVGYPAGEVFVGDLYCLDFNSLYPHCYMMCNIFDRVEESTPNAWHGGKLFEVEGYYNTDKMCKLSNMAYIYYNQRVEYKKAKDPREYSLKIILNTIYGLLGNPSFASVYDKIAAGDVTLLGRQFIKLSREIFSKVGYKVIYTDTDSVYILDPFNDKDKLLKTKDFIVKRIKSSVPFPLDTFDMGIDDEIKCMWFFEGKVIDKDSDTFLDAEDIENKKLGFMKKNYIYVTKSGKVKIKNLGIQKRSNTKLSKKIWEDYIVPELKTNDNCKFSNEQMNIWIEELLKADLNLIASRTPVKPAHTYALQSQLQAQVATKYGAGVHFLIPNTVYGVGKGKKYCTIEEFKKKKLNISEIELTKVRSELSYFIKIPKQVKLVSYEW